MPLISYEEKVNILLKAYEHLFKDKDQWKQLELVYRTFIESNENILNYFPDGQYYLRLKNQPDQYCKSYLLEFETAAYLIGIHNHELPPIKRNDKGVDLISSFRDGPQIYWECYCPDQPKYTTSPPAFVKQKADDLEDIITVCTSQYDDPTVIQLYGGMRTKLEDAQLPDNKPAVLVVSLINQPFSMIGYHIDIIIKVISNMRTIGYAWDSGKTIISFKDARKENGSTVKTQLFHTYNNLSAVIFCGARFWGHAGKQESDHIGCHNLMNAIMVRNPYAINPLPDSYIVCDELHVSSILTGQEEGNFIMG